MDSEDSWEMPGKKTTRKKTTRKKTKTKTTIATKSEVQSQSAKEALLNLNNVQPISIEPTHSLMPPVTQIREVWSATTIL